MPDPPRDGEMEELLTYIAERRNFDFRGYKRASLSRRILKRMQQLGVDSYEQYTEILEANPGEFAELFNTILINVTSFMRDPEAWQQLSDDVLPAILQNKAPEDPIRVWSAGCASGEEAYSLAVVLAEAAGDERFRQSVKIYATDADEDALSEARQGRYKEEDLFEAFGEDRARNYFDFDSGFGVFRSALRRSLIFGRHDLVQDPPISKVDLVVCRNTLMYFTAQVQLSVLATLHFALNTGGYLFLGKSEALVSRTQLFEAVDLRHHIFRKDGTNSDSAFLPSLMPARGRVPVRSDGGRLADSVLEHGSVPQLVLDNELMVVLANREARRLFGVAPADVGKPFREESLGLSPLDLRTPIDRAMTKRQQVTVNDVVRAVGPDPSMSLDVVISPLEGSAGVVISFVDVTNYQHLRDELEQSQRELESAYEELQSAVEELETTNEELQSTNEELETTNEELHSTNEELETMNEELQSTNEELETINNELRERSGEVDQLNRFLESILGSLQSAVIVLDNEMKVQAWNRQAEELWGLRANEVLGQHFLNLDIGFPVDTLRSAIRASIQGDSSREQLERKAINRRGHVVVVTVTVSSLAASQPGGVLILMEALPVLDAGDGAAIAVVDESDIAHDERRESAGYGSD